MKNEKLSFSECWYPEDVKRLSQVCANNGLFISPYNLQQAWEDHSENHYAAWLLLDDLKDNELFETVKSYL